ncbi:MAG: hypothetical protein J7L82_00945 [Staphylothermus sp.]|nr:hypothetical protein [Staphylothermus sp.]
MDRPGYKFCIDDILENPDNSNLASNYVPVVMWYLVNVSKGACNVSDLTRLLWLFEQGRLKNSTARKYAWYTIQELEKRGIVRVVRRGSYALVLSNDNADLNCIREYFSTDSMNNAFQGKLISAAETFKKTLLKELGVAYGKRKKNDITPTYVVALVKGLKKYAEEKNKRAYRTVVTFNRAVIGIPRLQGVWTREFSIRGKLHLHGVFVYDVVDKGTAEKYLREQIVKWLDKKLKKVPVPEVKEFIRREYLAGLYIDTRTLKGSGKRWASYMVKAVSRKTSRKNRMSSDERLLNLAVLWIKRIKWCSIRVNSEIAKAYAEIDINELS